MRSWEEVWIQNWLFKLNMVKQKSMPRYNITLTQNNIRYKQNLLVWWALLDGWNRWHLNKAGWRPLHRSACPALLFRSFKVRRPINTTSKLCENYAIPKEMITLITVPRIRRNGKTLLLTISLLIVRWRIASRILIFLEVISPKIDLVFLQEVGKSAWCLNLI